MPANKNALIRYKTIDNCLRRRYRRWTLIDLVEACSEAIYEYEGIRGGVSVRTIQCDIQMMRSDKLGYNAPIEVYDHKYYRYSDPDYSIMNLPLSQQALDVLQKATDMLRQLDDFDQFGEMSDVVSMLQEKLAMARNWRKPLVNFDRVPNLKGLNLLSPLYGYIEQKRPLKIIYKSFKSKAPQVFVVFPYLLKEFRNRWFLFAARESDMLMFNFALDRIEEVETIDIPFREKPEFDSEHFFDDVIGVTKNIGTKPHRIRFWANSEQSNYIKTKPIHMSQELIKEDPETHCCVFEIRVVVNFELISVLLSYGEGLKVMAPRMLKQRMEKTLARALQLYKSPRNGQ